MRVEAHPDQQATIHLEAPAGRTILTLEGSNVISYQFLDSATGVVQTYEDGELISRTNVDATRDAMYHDPVLLPLEDKRALDQFVHRLWTGEAEPADLPPALSGNYEISQFGEGYEVKRLSIKGVQSSGPSRYYYHYDVPLDEQVEGPTSLGAWYEEDGSITVELVAPSGYSAIDVGGGRVRVAFTHERLQQETLLGYMISSSESIVMWSPNSKNTEDDALLTTYLEELPEAVAGTLPPLPEALADRYVVHRTEAGFVIEHQAFNDRP